ncbi:vacuolar ATPase [Microsporum canis CBS 113480]|uniref:V-type proton ATPase subunit G n=1 Tax=Arthroderma otae (strain ATCC MYA-4605 / CBS 113480) TaxID=554155 RepID=C5FT94_ARTOC|nr:vacuolar ATPase [Microsporum canis CBS 113480]EEQ33097.1 vacuolar ATPase [Microsporum canis CBS 113480]
MGGVFRLHKTPQEFRPSSMEAQKIVQDDRTKRIKDAKTEAQKEIEDYKKHKEEEFRKFEAEHSSGNKKAENEANKDAEAQLLEIKKSGQGKGDKVVDDLIKAVLDVNPQVPEKLVKKA